MIAAGDAATRSASSQRPIAATNTPGVWVTAGQQDTFYGKVDRVNVLHDNGTVKEAPWGGPLADFAWAEAQCPGYTMSSVAKEPDY